MWNRVQQKQSKIIPASSFTALFGVGTYQGEKTEGVWIRCGTMFTGLTKPVCLYTYMLKRCALYALFALCVFVFLFWWFVWIGLNQSSAPQLDDFEIERQIFPFECFTKTLFYPPHSVYTYQALSTPLPVSVFVCEGEKNSHSWNNRDKSECFNNSHNLFVMVIHVTDRFCLASLFPSHMIHKQNMTYFAEATILHSLTNQADYVITLRHQTVNKCLTKASEG